MHPTDFMPDWTWTGTIQTFLDSHYSNLDFNGPGWYYTSNKEGTVDSLLVVPVDPSQEPFAQKWPTDTVYRFFVYNGRNPAPVFGMLGNAPVRQDAR